MEMHAILDKAKLQTENINFKILYIIHRSAFYLKHKVSETGFFLRFYVLPTQVGPIGRASPCLRSGGQGLALSIGPTWVGSSWRRRQNPISEALGFK
jgi:hypothetical protein